MHMLTYVNVKGWEGRWTLVHDVSDFSLPKTPNERRHA